MKQRTIRLMYSHLKAFPSIEPVNRPHRLNNQEIQVNHPIPAQALQLRSLVKASGELELSLSLQPVPEPQPNEVLIRIEAAPINPSDQGMLFGAADMSTAVQSGSATHPIVTARVPESALASMAGRFDRPMPAGNEGAGIVVKAGSSALAQSLLGKTVAAITGGMYAQYRCADAGQCLVLPAGTSAAEGASCFVNPLTSLGMVETLRSEGHKALVHTAAASNLGQMLQKICLKDGIDLVNIVRNSSSPNFREELTQALTTTGATIGFDATGGGTLASTILSAMEAALGRNAKEYNRYGSSTHKQVYIYGGLERGPTLIARDYGMAWGVGGWLLTPFLIKIGKDNAQRLRQRVVSELKTTFASQYTREVSLAEMLQVSAVAEYGKRATGSKYLVCPQRG
jgi:NADPH:quinone reductase